MVEHDYWERRYSEGGFSHKKYAFRGKRWKWKTINEIIGSIRNKSFIDVGCGDLKFWKYPLSGNLRKCANYVGIDISETIIEKNKLKYPGLCFFTLNAKDLFPPQIKKADIVLALDLLYHIMNDLDFEKILRRLCEYSDDWIIINHWINNPFAEQKRITDGKYQYYRNLSRYEDVFISHDFELKTIVKYPYNDYGALYFYRRFIY